MILADLLWDIFSVNNLGRENIEKIQTYLRNHLKYNYTLAHLIAEFNRLIDYENTVFSMIINLKNSKRVTLEDYVSIVNVLWFYVILL